MIILGLGTGRSGTASLAKLLNAQADALCFHEMNPTVVRFAGTPRPILNTINEFQAILDGGAPSDLTVDLGRGVAARAYDQLCGMKTVRLIGDIAFYYLTYVETIAEANPNVRFLCLKRDRDETVASWLRKTSIERWPSKRLADRLATIITREPYYEATNPWMEHDGSEWAIDPIWDKCFPKFPGPTREKAAGQYWDFYYEEAEALLARLPGRFRIIETETLNDQAIQRELLAFCGVAVEDQIHTDAHIHQSRAG
ncbi:MAG: sulfotransferase [Alphaproteobacteria bacterium]